MQKAELDVTELYQVAGVGPKIETDRITIARLFKNKIWVFTLKTQQMFSVHTTEF